MARISERDQEIWDLYLGGMTQTEIGKKYGVSQPIVSRILHRVRGYLPPPSRTEIRERMQKQLDYVNDMMVGLLEKPGAPVVKSVSRGENMGSELVAVEDPESGEFVRDYSLRVQAAKEIVRLQARLSALMGADEPTRVETTGTVRYEIVGIDTDKLK